MARIIGLDVHRTFADVAVHEHGRVRHAGRILPTAAALELSARGLTRRDHVVREATCNTHAIARLVRAHAGRVVVSNPRQARIIAEAKIKGDKIDAAVLIQLHASGFLPEVWMPDEGTGALRRQAGRVAAESAPLSPRRAGPPAGCARLTLVLAPGVASRRCPSWAAALRVRTRGEGPSTCRGGG
jgi:hypothetical protein